MSQSQKERLDAIGAALLTGILSRFSLEYIGDDFPTRNRYLRFHRKGQSLRVEITEDALDQQSADTIAGRLESEWQPHSDEDDAVLVYTDRIEKVSYHPF